MEENFQTPPASPVKIVVYVGGKKMICDATALSAAPTAEKDRHPDTQKLSGAVSKTFRRVFKDNFDELGGANPPSWKEVLKPVRVDLLQQTISALVDSEQVRNTPP